jgi:hypothetical protein
LGHARVSLVLANGSRQHRCWRASHSRWFEDGSRAPVSRLASASLPWFRDGLRLVRVSVWVDLILSARVECGWRVRFASRLWLACSSLTVPIPLAAGSRKIRCWFATRVRGALSLLLAAGSRLVRSSRSCYWLGSSSLLVSKPSALVRVSLLVRQTSLLSSATPDSHAMCNWIRLVLA